MKISCFVHTVLSHCTKKMIEEEFSYLFAEHVDMSYCTIIFCFKVIHIF